MGVGGLISLAVSVLGGGRRVTPRRDRQARAFVEVGRRVRRMHAVTRVALDVEFVERAAFQTSGPGGNSMNRPNAATLAVSSLAAGFSIGCAAPPADCGATSGKGGPAAVPAPHRLAGGAHVSRRLPRPGAGTLRVARARRRDRGVLGSQRRRPPSGAATVTAVSRGASLVSTAVLYQRLPTVIYGLADQGVGRARGSRRLVRTVLRATLFPLDVCKTQNETWHKIHGSARREAATPSCPKRPFTRTIDHNVNSGLSSVRLEPRARRRMQTSDASYRGLTTYQDIALLMGLPQSGNRMGKTEAGAVAGGEAGNG